MKWWCFRPLSKLSYARVHYSHSRIITQSCSHCTHIKDLRGKKKKMLTIAVTNPSKQTDKMGLTFTSYMVNTATTNPAFTHKNSSVVRRFRDFEWLDEELVRAHPGCIIPPLPEKQTLGRFSAEFVDTRKRALEKYLQRIAAHETLSQDRHFATFLQGEESELASAKSEAKATKPKMSTTAMGWMESTTSSIMNSGKKVELERSLDDMKVDEITSSVTTLEKLFETVTKNSGYVVQRQRDMAKSLKDMGQSFNAISENEKDDLVGVLGRTGETLDKITETIVDGAERESIEFEEALEEYLRILGSVHDTLKRREERRQAYINALTDHQAKDSAYNKVLGVSGKEDQASQKQQLVVKAQEAVDKAKDAFTELTATLLTEFEGFKERKAAEMREIVVKYATLQVEIAKKKENIWSNLLSEVDLSGGARAPPPSSVAGFVSGVNSAVSTGVANISAGVGNMSMGEPWKPSPPTSQPPAAAPSWLSETSSISQNHQSHPQSSSFSEEENMDNMEV